MMSYVYKFVKNIPIISFERDDGSLLNSSVREFGENIMSFIDDNIRDIVLDLRNNSCLSSFGLGELVNIRNFFMDYGINCSILIDNGRITKLLNMVGISELCRVIRSEEEI